MSITYQLDGSVDLVDDTDPSRTQVIPAGAADRDAQIAAFFPAVVPQSVTRLQGRLALLGAGLLDKVEAAVASAGGATAVWYQDADTWQRTDTFVLQLAAALQLTSQQVDGLFVQAGAISGGP